MSRRAFTLVEVAVAMLVGIIAVVVAYNALILLAKGEKATDRDASKALVDTRMMQMLLFDIRSSTGITEVSPKEFHILRYVSGANGRLEQQKVVWKTDDKKVQRLPDGAARPDEFDYTGVLDPKTPAMKLRVKRTTDVRFPP